MQLFSQKKAFIAVSLSALVALGACGDNVTVPVAPATPVTVSITPPFANLNVGESAVFNVQINGGSTTTPPTLASCASSSAAVATATLAGSACRATAIASGNATITGTTTTGQSVSAQVTVSAPAAAISGLVVTPATANLSVGQTVTIAATVNQGTGVTVARAYATSSATIASVNATTGVVTAVAPGVATITVTATGSGTGFTTTSLTSAVTVNVSSAPPGVTGLNVQPQSLGLAVGQTSQLVASATQPSGAATATITYGTSAPAVATVNVTTGVVTAVAPGTAVITVTATSAANASFSASTATALVPVTVAQPAQVIISSLTDNGVTIDITNVIGQFEVNMALQPNGQNVRSVQAFVCDVAAAVCPAFGQAPAAQQTFGASGGQAGNIQLYVNSADFGTPDFVGGADAPTVYKNGLKVIVATLTVGGAPSIASNNLSSINFNNPDGWTAQWTVPANRANDAGGNTWYGGPSTPDVLVPGSASGRGSFTVVPVIYTAGRTIASASLNIAGMFCGANILETARPFTATYGADVRSATTAPFALNCTGGTSLLSGYAPAVMASIDNNNAAGPVAQHASVGSTPAAATSVFTVINNTNVVVAGDRFRASQTYRPANIYIPGDYLAPVISAFDIAGGVGNVDSAWVNAAYQFARFSSTTGLPTRYIASDANVGLFTTASRNTLFNVCATPSPLPTAATATANTICSPAVASGGLTSTVGSIGLGESSADFTNGAYYVQAVETDRLGNRAISTPFGWTNSANIALTVTPSLAVSVGNANSSVNPAVFGVDITPPTMVAIANTGAGAATGFVRTDVDSIYSSLQTTYTGVNNANAVFGVRFQDSRSGFFTCTIVNCPTAANVRGGSYQITRRSAPSALSVTNDATVTSLVGAATSAQLTINSAINAPAGTFTGDPSIREFYVNIFGDNTRGTAAVNPTILAAQAGYYTFSATLVDRAGNTTVIPTRSVAIDNANPIATGILIPTILTGGQALTYNMTGSDDLEAIAGDLALTYPELTQVNGTTNAAPTFPNAVRYRRVASGGNEKLGFWHNPFASLVDNKLTTPIGLGTLLGSTPYMMPAPLMQNIVLVDGADAPLTAANAFALFGAANAEPRPTSAIGYLYDIRGASTKAWTGAGRSAPVTTVISGAQVSTPSSPATTKDWAGTGIVTWQAFTPSVSGTTVEYRATTSTSVTNPPFASVGVIRLVSGTEWEYLGTASAIGTLDQGALRFWRYSFTYTGQAQGAGVTMAALASGDSIRAIGTDASGNGLSARTVQLGLSNALPGSVTVTTAGAPATITNAGAYNVGTGAVTVGVSSNPNTANLSAACSSSNPAYLTATMGAGNVCQLSAVGTVTSGSVAVTVTYSVAGSASGFNSNTVTTAATVTRIP